MVFIYNSKGKPIASGLVASKGPYNYLYCGSLNREYRKKGIRNLLVAARQSVSAVNSESIWITSARNPKIKGKGDLSFKMISFSKV